MGMLRRLTASWMFFWAVNGALLVSALAIGLVTAGGRLRMRIGLVIIAFLLGVVAVQCYRALREWRLRKRARPLAQKGFELGRQGRSEEAIAAYDEFLARWGGTDEDALHWLVGMVLVNRAIRLEGLGGSKKRSHLATRFCIALVARPGLTCGSMWRKRLEPRESRSANWADWRKRSRSMTRSPIASTVPGSQTSL